MSQSHDLDEFCVESFSLWWCRRDSRIFFFGFKPEWAKFGSSLKLQATTIKINGKSEQILWSMQSQHKQNTKKIKFSVDAATVSPTLISSFSLIHSNVSSVDIPKYQKNRSNNEYTTKIFIQFQEYEWKNPWKKLEWYEKFMRRKCFFYDGTWDDVNDESETTQIQNVLCCRNIVQISNLYLPHFTFIFLPHPTPHRKFCLPIFILISSLAAAWIYPPNPNFRLMLPEFER